MSSHVPDASETTQGADSHQVLTFVLGNETYGVDILRVHEIRGWSTVTRIPHAPPHILGVLNLRGSIVPIIDLRMRFDLDRADYSAVTVIVVLSVIAAGTRRDFGVVVDGVSDVIDVHAAEVKAPPELGDRVNIDYVRGLLPLAERMVVLLDIDRLIGADIAAFSRSSTPPETASAA